VGRPLYVALVWHMHQPFYKDTLSGEYSLPWARLHAIKDYLHMVELVAEQPKMHATFNMVPCLVEQLTDYAEGRAADRALVLSVQETWTPEEKEFMLSFFFNLNWDRFIRHYPRYAQLLDLRQRGDGQASLFGDSYYRDLAAWFNLAWIDRLQLEQDETLKALVAKGHDYTRDDVQTIIRKQREIIARIIPRYHEMEERGQIEISTSPYYHPILPLLIDVHAARESDPKVPLPTPAFAHPEDAVEQIRRGIAAHHHYFGRHPRGMWPSEGAVSQALLPLISRANGVQWLATDEGILARSLNTPIQRDGYGHVTNPRFLYRPYQLNAGDAQRSLQVIFRDIVLSDRIGFVYKHMNSVEAANDLISRLHRIRQNLNDPNTPYLVSIILDGENCWEEYEDNGTPFLRALYDRLTHDSLLQPVTVSEYLEQFPTQEMIPRLFAGSWISHSFATWIGESAQNRAWQYLARTRQWLTKWQSENPLVDTSTLERAWEEIYIAEGSDWFWWYYSHNNPAGENLFDREFRRHLRNVYRVVGVDSPNWLETPIHVAPKDEAQRPISRHISPPLSTAEKPSAAWSGAGYIEARASTGAMQRAETVVQRLYYGYDQENLYLRIETNQDLSSLFLGVYLSLPRAAKTNLYPRYAEMQPSLHLPITGFQREIAVRGWTEPVVLSRAAGQEVWEPQMNLPARLDSNVAEIQVPLAALEVQKGDLINLLLVAAKDRVVLEVLPPTEALSVALEDLT